MTNRKLIEKLAKLRKKVEEEKENLSKDRKNLSSLINLIKLNQDICIAEAYVKGYDEGQAHLIEEILKGEVIDSTKNDDDEIKEFILEMNEILHK